MRASISSSQSKPMNVNEINIVESSCIAFYDFEETAENLMVCTNTLDEDEYESNDNVGEATCINVENYHTLNEYNQTICATLDADGVSVDYDFYYFTLLNDSDVSISVVAERIDYNFVIDTYDVYPIPGN